MNDEHLHHTKAEFVEELSHHDEWFRHSAAEQTHQEAHGSTRTHAILASLFFTLVLVVVVGVVVFHYFQSQARILQTTLQEAATPRDAYVAATQNWNNQLSTYGWVEEKDGPVRLPLDVAIERVVDVYKSQGN